MRLVSLIIAGYFLIMANGTDSSELILDGTKIMWHGERLAAWQRGERIAPITIDMALTDKCNYACRYCYADLQGNKSFKITREHMTNFIDDCAEIGVKAISLVSDGESTLSPQYVYSIQYGASKGLSMASGTNAYLLKEEKLREVLPHLTYLRVNITAGEPERYKQIMGVKDGYFEQVCENIKTMVRLKKELGLSVTIGMQMVLMPEFADQIIPLSLLGKSLRPDYLVIKHCSDDEDGSLGVNYAGYKALEETLKKAERLSDETYKVVVKWSKIKAEGTRSYERCYGPPFLLQLSGTGLIAPCGMLFNDKYKKFHIGNITSERFRDVFKSDRYWEVMDLLSSDKFNAKTMCGSLCLQHKTNEYLDGVKKGDIQIEVPAGESPAHLNFI